MTEKEQYNLACSFSEKEQYQKAILIFKKLLETKKSDKYDQSILFQIGGCYYFGNDPSNALSYYSKAQTLDDTDESTSLGIYLSFVKLNRTTEAVKELNRYASKYRIELYRDTILELMSEISRGNATAFKDIVFSIAERHDVSIKSGPK